MLVTESTLVIAWIARIVHFIDFCIIIKYILNEYRHIRQDKCNVNWQAIFSISTMTICLLLAITRGATYIPIICLIAVKSAPIFWNGKNILLTFYQIRRLQNSFSADSLNELHFKQYGYNKSTFIILYAFGLFLLALLPLFGLFSSSPVSIPQFGCLSEGLEDTDKLILSVSSLLYYIWDWTVLTMYIFRIIQIKRAINLDNKEMVYHKIKAILTKIISLTICYELAAMIYIVILIGFKGERENIMGIVLSSLDILIPVFILYLMHEHNNEKYIKCLNILERLCCFCLNWKKSKNTDNKNEIYQHGVNLFNHFAKSTWIPICCCIFMFKMCLFVVVLVVIIEHI